MQARPGFFARVAANPAGDWVLLFLAIQCAVNLEGFTNTHSRWATLAAMTEDHSFRIDQYHQHTIDWAQTPDRHFYSNKAPGPALLGYPLFLLMDKISTRGAKNREERDQRRVEDRNVVLLVSLVVPILLFILLFSTADVLAQPDDSLFPFYLNRLIADQGKNLSRCLFIVLGFAWVSWRAVQSVRREEASAAGD